MAGIFQEADGAASMRRVLAAFFAVSAVALAVVLPLIAGVSGWHVFIPCGACIFASLLLLFFTTWSDVAATIAAAKGR